jgi:ribosomal protein S18 acetylase RimI-like enzyme
LIIEQAGIKDAGEILKLQKLAYRSEAQIYNDYSIPPMTETIGEVESVFKDHIVLKASTDRGAIIGSVRAHMAKGTCLIGRLIVHPDSQNRGIGASLLREIEERFSRAERFELFTGNKSERNLYLYRKLGYREFRSEKVNDTLDLVYLEKLNDTA